MAKALVFGLIAAIVASYKGMNAGGGPKGVGDAVNESVVIVLHAPVRRQLRDERDLLPARPAEDGLRSRPWRASRRSTRSPCAPSTTSAASWRSSCAPSRGRRRRCVRYKKEILRILAEVTLGSGALAVIGGTVGVITAMCFFTGTEVGLQGYAALNQIGTAAFSGFVSAYFNTREIAPLVAGIALAATVGCGFTAQLGAMRISEEVDALEVMAMPVAAVPGHHPHHRRADRDHPAVRRGAAVVVLRDPADRHPVLRAEHRHLRPLLPHVPAARATCSGRSARCWSSRSTVILIHCYYGYNASGGPAGVGVAVGEAVRTSIVAINVIDLFLSMAIWGATTTVRLAG